MSLTQIEQDSVALFADDSVLFPAVVKVVKEKLDEAEESLLIRVKQEIGGESNETIGAKLRGCAEGRRLVEAIFRELAQNKKELPKKLKVNPGR